MEPTVTIVCALITVLFTGWLAWLQGRSHQQAAIRAYRSNEELLTNKISNLENETARMKQNLSTVEAERDVLRPIAVKYEEAKERLLSSSIVRHYQQPVLLLGPRYVGKTSLLAQWHSPWVHSDLEPTRTIEAPQVPVFDLVAPDKEPHFAIPDIKVPVSIHLGLQVYDFPGELKYQNAALEIMKKDALNLIDQTSKNIGIVLICMFDAAESHTGISKETEEYYNGDLFRNLRDLVAHSQLFIERVVLVFNKFDLLRLQAGPELSDRELQQKCVERLSRTFRLLSGACNPDRFCEVFSILDRKDILYKNQGAPIILGEAARAFVEAFAGRAVAKKVVPYSATQYSSMYI